jgi:plasmid stability protein
MGEICPPRWQSWQIAGQQLRALAFLDEQAYLCTHKLCDMKNVTLSIPDDLLAKSREYASKHGTSLNEFIRVLLRQAIAASEQDPVKKLIAHSQDVQIQTKKLEMG